MPKLSAVKISLVLLYIIIQCSVAESVSAQPALETLWPDFTPNIQDNSPYTATVQSDSKSADRPVSFDSILTLGTIRLYQKLISPSHGTPCPMYPSCSQYAFQAFQTYNPFKAFAMTADRLHRCGHDLNNYTLVEVDDGVRFADPVLSGTADNNQPVSLIHFGGNDQQPHNSIHNYDLIAGDNINPSATSDEQLFNFAQSLEVCEDYPRAITEYERLIYFYPNSSYKIKALTSIFRCYYKSGQYLATLNWGERLLGSNLELPEKNEILFLIGVSYFKLTNLKMARSYFDILSRDTDNPYHDQSRMLIGLSFAIETNWDQSYEAFSKISPDSKLAPNARNCARLAQEGKNLKFKNPKIAGALAIIPGAGYLYCGYKQTALSSFIVNSLFIKGTSESFERSEQGLGTVLGIFSLGWYSGNIYGSIKSAEKKNIWLVKNHLAKFELGFKF